jgi:hypothetical protein
MKKQIRVVMGTDSPTGLPTETSNKCYECGKTVYFADKWDWSKYKPICEDCLIKKSKKNMGRFVLLKKTIKTAMEYGLSEDEVREIYKKIADKIKRGRKPTEQVCVGG